MTSILTVNSTMDLNPFADLTRYLLTTRLLSATLLFKGMDGSGVPTNHAGDPLIFRIEDNRGKRKQRIMNKWGIGRINRKWRVLLGGRPSFEEIICPVAYELGVILISRENMRNRRKLVPLEKGLENIDPCFCTGGW